ncbi:helix-turn-helix transcriptional regulator [Pedobacter caeni]|uniref:Predicted DNA-binding transcriptional regulator YafY, contains an HTH and WYL domains n=1 Tax=Pedobacter caeni TaxID=288992 RepID=A0A1M4TTJ6_9SPHI|nr:YafY family protein [Pedobacter caeni]SHE47773.1 Predicted DNA-binding transcriptional regulator YafY, contains an HTH and WYL domains [Pedobacter caeni]
MENIKKFERVVHIFFLLQSRSVLPIEELMEKFQVTKRTIYRDLNMLERVGLPIVHQPGAGYSIVDGFRLPPSRFTEGEVLSVMIAEKIMRNHETESIRRNFDQVLTKIKSSFHSQQKKEILHLQDKLLIKEKFDAKDYVPNIMDTLLKSSVSKRLTEILYKNAKGDHPNSRTVEPIGVFNENGNWYLLAYCHSRSDYRNFRLDRIQKIAVLQKHFEKAHPSVNELNALYHAQYFTEITISVDQKYAHFLSFERDNFGYVKEMITDETVLMYFNCKAHPTSFVRWFLRFIDVGEIIEPIHLKEELAGIVKAGLNRMQK